MPRTPLTVIEVDPFPARAARLWDEEEKSAFIDFIARNPKAGDLVSGAGGIRKVRWAASGRGKRGGARVIYYFYDETAPLFLLTAYAKSEQADLSPDEKRKVAAFAAAVKRGIRSKRP
ncbi:MAG: addiction module toxin RelE [Alphaproteobacteria bacterium]|nr:addiction module toxin RelE [Alphaproteobacteria bacterium]